VSILRWFGQACMRAGRPGTLYLLSLDNTVSTDTRWVSSGDSAYILRTFLNVVIEYSRERANIQGFLGWSKTSKVTFPSILSGPGRSSIPVRVYFAAQVSFPSILSWLSRLIIAVCLGVLTQYDEVKKTLSTILDRS
jgi:hypothetical protein